LQDAGLLFALFVAALIYSRSARADGFSATAAVDTCEIQGGGFPSGLFNCPGIGGALLSSMTAQASETLFGSNGKTTVTGIAAVNGPPSAQPSGDQDCFGKLVAVFGGEFENR
jgi:hypothetical protein